MQKMTRRATFGDSISEQAHCSHWSSSSLASSQDEMRTTTNKTSRFRKTPNNNEQPERANCPTPEEFGHSTPKQCQKQRRRRGSEDRLLLLFPLAPCSTYNSTAFLLPTLLLLISLFFFQFGPVEAVRCYCTDEHCVPYGVCEAPVCLVGLLRSNNAVIRTCGNEPIGCQRNWDRWSHLCSCDEHFCNTFLFLKASTSIDGGVAGTNRGRPPPSAGERVEGDHRVFERVDGPAGEFATFDHQIEEEERPIKNSNLLTLLLVIVPLSVGAAAVVVVAINYYCHLC